jgi:hypothetical protein
MKLKPIFYLIVLIALYFSPGVLAKTSIGTYPLKWDAKDGEIFEIEITSENKATILETKQVTTNSFNFSIPRPGIFYWRVRQQSQNQWSPFSNYSEILVEDKISLIEKPLMKKSLVKGNEFTFEWSEPFKDFKYVLNVYRGKTSKAFLSVPVAGGKKTVTIDKDEENIYWRVSAVSVHGNESSDKKKFLIPSSSEKSRTQFIFRAYGFQTMSAYEQTSDDENLQLSNRTLSLSGLSVFLKGEIWKKKLGAVLSVRNQILKSGDADYSETEIHGELGYHWKQSEVSRHNLLAGLLYGSTTLKFDDNEGMYKRIFLTFRHSYERFFMPQFSFGNDTTILQAIQGELNPPNLRIMPALNWYFKPNWWLSGFVGYELNRSKLEYSEDGSEGNLDITSNVLHYGLSLNWKNI